LSAGGKGEVFLEVVNVSKRFGPVQALDNVSMDVRSGEVHALLGENGAGKSTLCNIIAGMLKPDSGEIRVDGRRVVFGSTRDASRHGIGIVYQEFMLIPELTVAENIALFQEGNGRLLLDREAVKKSVERLMSDFGLRVDLNARVGDLSAGEKQKLEIVKALMREVRLLILDEPTSIITPIEARELFRTMRRMAEAGKSVIFVTHRIDEVMEVADRITVLRGGKKVATVDRANVTPDELVRMMVGRSVSPVVGGNRPNTGNVALKVSGLRAMGDLGSMALKGVDLEVRYGEVVGICGVTGNGQKELVEVIIGVRKPVEGKVWINGTDVTEKPPHFRRKLGMAYLPEEHWQALWLDMRLYENFSMPPLIARLFRRLKLLKMGAIKRAVSEEVKRFEVRTPSVSTELWKLSGGNKQRFLVAREVYTKPSIIVANNPTKGLDVLATEFVRKFLLDFRDQGGAVLLISSDLEEVLQLSDRALVIFDGRIVGSFAHDSIDVEKIASLMLRGAQNQVT
jgi:simple sugar transport system ATP-binding protein